MPTAEELILEIQATGSDDAQADLEAVEQGTQDVSEELQDTSEEMQDFREQFSGALSAAVAGLAVGVAGLASTVPVVGELFGGLTSIMEAFGLQVDQLLRDLGIGGLTGVFYDIAGAVASAEGPLGDIAGAIGILGATIGSAIGGYLTFLTVTQGIGAAFSAIVGGVKTFVGLVTGLVSGATAAAAALGGLLGVLGVMALDALGVLDAIKNLGSWVRDMLPGWLRDGITSALALLSGPLTTIGAFIVGTIQGGFDEGVKKAKKVLEIFIGALVRTGDRIIGAVEDFASAVKDVLVGLANDALEWGEDLVSNFVDGIQNNVGEAKDAVGDAFDQITPDLQFDLRENDQMAQRWGSDMIQHFALGANQKAQDVNLATPFSESAPAQTGGTSGGSTMVNLDGRRLNESTGRYGYDQLTRRGI